MSLETETASSGAEILIECNDVLDVSMLSDFKTLLHQAAGQNSPIALDASQLERVDGAALQLMAAFFVEAQESGLSVTWRSPSDALKNAANLTGLDQILQL